MGVGPEAGLLGEPTWAGAINRDCGNRQRSNAEAQHGHGFYRSATYSQGLTAVVGAGEVGKASAGVACASHTEPSAAAGIDYSRVEGQPGALRTTVTQDLIGARERRAGAFGLEPAPLAGIILSSVMITPTCSKCGKAIPSEDVNASVFVLVALAGTLRNLGIPLPHWFPAPNMNGSPISVGMTIFLWIQVR